MKTELTLKEITNYCDKKLATATTWAKTSEDANAFFHQAFGAFELATLFIPEDGEKLVKLWNEEYYEKFITVIRSKES